MILSSESNLKLIIINMLEKKENMTVDEYELYLSLTVPNEIKEIKMKCISAKNDVKFETASIKNPTDNINAALIKHISYFKNYFD